MRLDRKLLLIAPTIVLLFVFAGFIYTAAELRVLSSVSNNWQDRNDYIAAVQRGEKPLEPSKALVLLQFALDAEAKRTAAIPTSPDVYAHRIGRTGRMGRTGRAITFVEPRQTRDALGRLASRELVLALSVIGLLSCAVLAVGVRSVPRETWPTLRVRGGGGGGGPE